MIWKVAQYTACSAVGQIFIFRVITRFDPLIVAVVTASRKFASVIATLLVFGYEVNVACLVGIMLAGGGMAMIFSGELRQRSNHAVADTKRSSARIVSSKEQSGGR